MDIHYPGELTQPAKFWTKLLKISSCECTSNPIKGSITGWAPGPTLASDRKELKPGFATC